MTVTSPARRVEEVLSLYERVGSDPYDEELSQTQHALQTAALARRAGVDDELVVAALLHDVGHLLELDARADDDGSVPSTDLEHESVGARHLATLFGPGVTGPIALHVRAKRHLCAIDPGYHATLSEGSRRSLERQGGPSSPTEVRAFEANPSAAAALELRRWDDGGKVEGLEVEPFEHYEPLLVRLARTG